MAGYIGPIPVPQATQTRETFTATASQTTFNTAGYQPGYLDVFMNGVKLIDGSDYTATNGSDVVLSSGAAVNDLIEVVAYTAFEVLNQNFTGTTTVADLTVTGDLTVDGTTTTINSTTLNVDDINITVASGAANAAAANGAGLTVDGANATFNYASSGDKWTMNKDLDITGGLYTDGIVNIQKADGTFIQTVGTSNNTGYINWESNGWTFYTNGPLEALRIGSSEIVVNEDSRDYDFRVESNGNENMIFVDADQNRVSIGSSSGYQTLNVNGNIAVGGLGNKGILFGDNITSTSDHEWLLANNASSGNAFTLYEYDSGTYVNTRMIFSSGGGTHFYNANNSEFVINQGSNDVDFRVESDNMAAALFVEGSSGLVGIGNNSPVSNGNQSTYGITIGNGDGSGRVHINANGGGAMFSGTDTANSASAGFKIGHLNGTNRIEMEVGTTRIVDMFQTAVAFNNGGANMDFRVESDTRAHLLFLDADSNNINFGNSSSGGQYNGTGSNGVGFNNTGANGQYVTIQNGSDSNLYLSKVSGHTDARLMQFAIAGSTKGSVQVTSSGTTYNTTSDRRLKTDIQPIANGTEKLMAMNPVSHRWKLDPDGDAVHGFIAQEMQEIVPEAVSGDPDGEEMMSMDYGRITPVLVAALQDAHKKIEALEERLAELEAN